MTSSPPTQNAEHLRLLSIFHYVLAGLAALFALMPIMHLAFGLVMALAPEKLDPRGHPPPPLFGWLLVAFAATFIVLGSIFAILVFVSGRFLAKRKHYMYCLVIAAIECLFMPFGTALGVFTIIVLIKEDVKRMFAHSPPPL